MPMWSRGGWRPTLSSGPSHTGRLRALTSTPWTSPSGGTSRGRPVLSTTAMWTSWRLPVRNPEDQKSFWLQIEPPPPQGNLAFAPCMDVSISSSSLRLRFFLTKMYLANSDTCWFTRCSQYLLVQSSIYLLPKHCLYSPAFSVIMASAASLLGHGRRNTAHDERTSLWATQCFPYFLFVIIALPKLHRGVPLSNFNSLSFSRQSKF